MKAALLMWFKANAAKHVEAILIAAACLFIERTYMQEHDARLMADAQVKVAQVAIADLQKQQSIVAQATKSQVIVLQQRAADVKTPAQAVQALQQDKEVTAVLPTLQPVPDNPALLQVSAVDLFKGVNACEQDAVTATSCTKELDLEKQIDTQKDVQITALKKKPRFLARLGKALKIIGCSAAGGAIGGLTKSAEGAAIGAATGAGVCQAF